MLSQQSFGEHPQKITMNGVRLLRQAALTGEAVHHADVVALCGEFTVAHVDNDLLRASLKVANHSLDTQRAEAARLKRVLAEWEQNQLEATSDAYSEGYEDAKHGREHRNVAEIIAALDAVEVDD